MGVTGDPIALLLVDGGSAVTGETAASIERADDRFSVAPAPTANRGLDRLGSAEFDCVLAAENLPDRRGLDFFDTVRGKHPDLPFVLRVDDREGNVVADALSAGVTDCVRPPGDPADYALLTNRLSNAVRVARVEAESDRDRRRLDQFVSAVSHDLRNPLNVAQGRLDLARTDPEGDHVDIAADAVDRSLELIGDLLTLATQGTRPDVLEPVSLEETVEGCWATVETADATLVVESDRRIRANQSRLKQLFENLIRNAIEHGSDDVRIVVGSIDPMYTSTRAGGDGGTGFYVADDGPGIPADERDRVFDIGYTTANSGTGFGLNIVRETAEAHGWNVRVTESKHGGARFEITGVDSVD